MRDCFICNCVKQNAENEYYDEEIDLVEGGWTVVKVGRDPIGRIYIQGSGDGRTDRYYPNFCPNCGAQLAKKPRYRK